MCPIVMIALILMIAMLCGMMCIRSAKKRLFGCPHPVYPWLRE